MMKRPTSTTVSARVAGVRRRCPAGRAHRAAGVRAGLVVALAALAVLALLPAAALAGVDDWQHTWEVVGLANALQGQPKPPDGVMVYYLGDSIARESTVSDQPWTRQLRIRAATAGKARAFGYTVAGHNQTFGMDEMIVQRLPATAPGQPRGLLLIGVGISRFIGPPTPQQPFSVDPPPAGELPELSPWRQHLYDGRAPLSSARKRELVQRWMDRRWAGFRRNEAANLAAIERLIKTARAKGLQPVILDLPLNTKAVGTGLDKPRRAIRAGCSDLARRYGIEYVHFTQAIGLPSSAYWDLHHLLAPGYTRWQSRLSAELVKLLPARATP